MYFFDWLKMRFGNIYLVNTNEDVHETIFILQIPHVMIQFSITSTGQCSLQDVNFEGTPQSIILIDSVQDVKFD